MSVTQAAEKSGFDPSQIRRAIRAGLLRADKLGKRAWLIMPDALDEWLNNPEAHRSGPKGPHKTPKA